MVWVVNAFFVWLPLVRPATEFEGQVGVGGGWTAFVGATVFEGGSLLLIVEAGNSFIGGKEGRNGEGDGNEKGKGSGSDTMGGLSGCWGWVISQVRGDGGGEEGWTVHKGGCQHHHAVKSNLIGRGEISAEAEKDATIIPPHKAGGRTWRLFPSLYDLRTHYLRELGFLASLAQLVGATVFWISGFTALPGINDRLSRGLLDGVYWAPQVVGGVGFIVSGYGGFFFV